MLQTLLKHAQQGLSKRSPARQKGLDERALLKDLNAGFAQQMYLWGLDVEHPNGNLLEQSGFERRLSLGLKGASCYSLPWEQGRIELHGSQAGYQKEDGGVYFVRPLKGCVHWPETEPPVPGIWRELDHVKEVQQLELLLPLIRWWLAHEEFVNTQCGSSWRREGIEKFLSLPRKQLWLQAEATRRWLETLLEQSTACPRARSFA